jgi:hypothetical protein
MVVFLSDDWLDRMTAAAASVDLGGDDAPSPLRIRQVVTGDPSGPKIYDLAFSADGITVDRAATGEADVVFEQDGSTARRLARGETHPQVELTAGRLRIGGAANRLTEWRAALDALDEALADLRAETTW